MLDLLCMSRLLILDFLLLLEMINATVTANYTLSSISAQNVEAAAESSAESIFNAGLFIDCSSCKCPFPTLFLYLVLTQVSKTVQPVWRHPIHHQQTSHTQPQGQHLAKRQLRPRLFRLNNTGVTI